jgi:acetylornithine deacetylase/succinyl-diaminopimelate desuccinylase-like protein
MIALAEQGVRLSRDVILAATADEEHGGTYGMGWLAQHDPEVLQVACALNEGGGSAIEIGGRLFYTCQTAEKGICRTVWTAQGDSGHASQPRDSMATLRLARALGELGDGHVHGRAVETMRSALLSIAGSFSSDRAARVAAFLDQGQIEGALSETGFSPADIPHVRSLFYDTVSPTVLAAGDVDRINVIPAVARAYLDGRILPGQTSQGFVQQLRELAGDEIHISLHERAFTPGLESATDAPILSVISQVIAEQCPGASVVPWQCPGSTDAKHLIPRGVPVYGFVPSMPLPEGRSGGGAHSVNERIDLENLYFGYQVLYEVVRKFCA